MSEFSKEDKEEYWEMKNKSWSDRGPFKIIKSLTGGSNEEIRRRKYEKDKQLRRLNA